MTSFNIEYIIYIFAGAIFMGSIGLAFFQKTRRDELLANQADKRGGQFVKGSLSQYSQLRLPYKGNILMIYCRPGNRNSPPRTIATLHLDNAALPTIEILRNNLA